MLGFLNFWTLLLIEILSLFNKFLANKNAIKDEGIETNIPKIITLPIWSIILKLSIIAMGPGVGGIKVCEEYNPPDKDRFKLDSERDEEDAIDLDIPFNIKKAESQKTTVPIRSPRIFRENKDLFWKELRIIFPNLLIEFDSFKICPIIQLKKMIKPIPFNELIKPITWKVKVSNNPIFNKSPSIIPPINKLIAGFSLNFALKRIIAKIDRSK